jgi:hypothetical protein
MIARIFRELPCRAALPVWSVITLTGLFAVAARATTNDSRVVLLEDFEGYTNTTSLLEVWREGASQLETEAPGGGNAVLHDGGDLTSRAGFSIQPDASHDVLFSADLYDFATNAEKRVTIALRNGSGANLEFGHIYETGPYAMRIGGFAEPTDWVSFDSAIMPRNGWNRFRALISMTNTVVTVDLGADGSVDKTLVFVGRAPTRPFTSIRFGGLPGRKSHGGPVLVDNIELAFVPAGVTPPSAIRAAVNRPTSGATVQAVTQASSEPTNVAAGPTSMAAAPAHSVNANSVLWWIVGALVVIIALLGALLFVLRRSSRAAPMPVATIPSGIPEVVRNPALAELTEFAKQSLVQGLYSQRQVLIETQKKAQQELAELEARLTALQLPLDERIRAYEKRIAELEKQLESRGEEMHEITRITLQLVREKLEEEKERERSGGEFN